MSSTSTATLRARRRRTNTAASYAPAHVPGTAAQFAYLADLTSSAPPATCRLLLHILTSRRISEARSDGEDITLAEIERLEGSPVVYPQDGDDSPFIPVPAVFIKRHFRGASWAWLVEAGLVDVRPYSRVPPRSREFRATLEVRRQFAGRGLTARKLADDGLVNLVSGKATVRRVKSSTTTPSGNALPALVRAAMDAVTWSLFSSVAIEQHLRELKQTALNLPAGPSQKSAWSRYLSDDACYKAALSQGAESLADAPAGMMRYRPAYAMQRTGRLGQKGGGLQSASRHMKAVAYTGVPEFRNYDLQASQARILIVLLLEAGIDPEWLVEYGTSGKEASAAFVGISVDAWKKALYSVLMGARIPSVNQAAESRGALVSAIRAAVAPAQFVPTYALFLDRTEGLRLALRDWHRWLDDVFVRETGHRSPDGRIYVRNQVGAARAVDSLSARSYERKAQLAAFLLQGREAAFTHALAASSDVYGFSVLSHEHDGLAVQGDIPDAAVAKAAEAAKLPLDLVRLVEKPFK